MIVVDASAMVEALAGTEVRPVLLDALADDLAAPHHLDAEVLSALRGLHIGRRLDLVTADRARADFYGFAVVRYELEPLADRIWALRHRYTAYDAAYLALAEALRAPLCTCDAKLDSGGHDAEVRVRSR
ncbi:MAG: type II toxin-antitoxin system VapC family toxin [Actinomycetaceae bacterium]